MVVKCLVKGEAVPVQAWTGTEGSRSLRLPEFLDSRHMKTHTVIILIDVYFLNLSLKWWNSRPSESMTASYHSPSNSSFTVLGHCTVYAPDSCRQWFYPPKVRPGYGTAQQAATVTSYAMEKRAFRECSQHRQKCFSSEVFRQAVGPNQPLIQWVPRAL